MAWSQETKTRIAEIEAEQARLKGLLNKTLKQLDSIEKTRLPDSQFSYVSLKRAMEIKDLAGPPMGIRAALKQDIERLRTQIAALKREATEVRNFGVEERFRRKREAVRRANLNIEAHARKIMREASKRGYLTDDELAEVQAGAEVGLESYTDLLEERPTVQGMRDVLDQLAVTMSLNMEGTDAQKAAMAGLQTASQDLVDRAKQDFAAKPTSANMRKLLGNAARAAVVGNEAAQANAIAELAPWAEKQRDAAEARFRKIPSSDNFKTLFNAEANCIRVGGRPLPQRPAGLQRVKDGDSHTLAVGESLSRVSQTYYGSFSYWDVIARANVDVIKDFDFPPAGVTLIIP
jgi:hypothetical protein